MARVSGPSLDQFDRLGDDYAALVAHSLAVSADGMGHGAVEDLAILRTLWAGHVDGVLLPALGVAFEVGAATIRVGLREATGLIAAGVSQGSATVAGQVSSEAGTDSVGEDGWSRTLPLSLRREGPALTSAAFTDVSPTSDALAEQYLAQARNRLVGVGDELWAHAREELLEGLRAGEGVAELAARVRKVAPDLTEPRAAQIARSEVMGAVNAGALEQVLATGVTGTKTWEAGHDQRVRPEHKHADEQTVGLREKFTVGGFPADRPHDPSLPPHLSTNCRCALSFSLDLPDVREVTVELDPGPLGDPTAAVPPLVEATTSQKRDRSFLARVVADGLAALVGWFKARTAAAMIPEQEFEGRKVSGPPGGQLFPGWDPSAHSLTESLETNMPGQMSPAQGAVGDPRRFSIPQRGDEMTDASQPVEHFHYRMAEGVSTGLRTFASGAITWRVPPFAFMWQKMIPESGGHGLAVQAGLITRAERSGELIDFYGPLDLNSDDGLEYARRLVEGFARWGSVSPDENKVDVEVVWAEGLTEEDMALGAKPEQYVFRSFNVAELTALSVPALADATIEPTPALLEELERRGALPAGVKAPRAEALAAAVHTITIPDIPPAWWFEEPTEDPEFGAVEITDEGRLFGLIAPKNVAHRGFSERVVAPVGHTDYAEFHEPRDFGRFQNPPVLVERDGKVERIKAGCLTFAGGHAPTTSRYDWLQTIKHYDESESVVARVRIGENSKGVWVAGYVLPDVTPYQLQRMMACQLSGDWRPHKEKPGWYDFAAALFVPVPGFPMAASGAETLRGPVLRFQEDRLVASAVPVRHAACACPTPLAASGGPDLSRVKKRIAAPILASRRTAAAARLGRG